MRRLRGGRRGRVGLGARDAQNEPCGCLYREMARGRGVFGPSDRDRALRTERGTRWAAGGLRRGVGLREEERKRGPAVVSETETSDD